MPRLQEMRIVVGFKCNRGKVKAGFRGLFSRDCTHTHPRSPFAAIAAYAAATQASLVTKWLILCKMRIILGANGAEDYL